MRTILQDSGVNICSVSVFHRYAEATYHLDATLPCRLGLGFMVHRPETQANSYSRIRQTVGIQLKNSLEELEGLWELSSRIRYLGLSMKQ